MRREGCQRKWKTAHTSRTTKSNSQTTMACLEKPRVICGPGTLTQIHQRVAIGRKRISNNLSISESTASPTTKLTRTSSTCKELQNKFRNLAITKEIVIDDSPEDILLSEKTAKKIHEAGNCELHEIQQRTNKGMSMRRKVGHVRSNAFQHQTKK